MSTIEIEALGEVRNISERASIFYYDTRKLEAQLSLFSLFTKVKVVITQYDEKKEKDKLRTIGQNKYYHLLLDLIAEHTGDISHHDLHRKLKRKFLGVPYIEEDKEYIEVPSTTGLSTKKFGEYLEKIFLWASEEMDIILPSSSDYYK